MLLYYYVFKSFPTRKQSFIRIVALIQGIYYFVTGLWPILDIQSFMAVTGPKTDIWLVKMVGALTIAISLLLFAVAKKMRVTLESIILILAAGLSYLCIDIYYSVNKVISFIYLGDAALQLIFIVVWVNWLFTIRFRLRSYKH